MKTIRQLAKKQNTKNVLCLIWCLLLISWSHGTYAQDSGAIAVLYPDIREPYRSVFSHIIDGIKEESKSKVTTYKLTSNWNEEKLRTSIINDDSKAVIALGIRGFKAAQSLDMTIPVIIGAILQPPVSDDGKLSGISLTPDPDIVFSHLKSLKPNVKQVNIVYKPERSQWLIDITKVAAARHGLKLFAIEANNIQSAAKKYHSLLENSASQVEAIWLLQDPSTVDGRVILPLILEKAWKNRFVTISNNPTHVKQGVLFALYPDNFAMGRSLAKLSKEKIKASHNAHANFMTLKDLKIAVNLRTADHLDLDIDKQKRRGFNLTFPSP